MIRLMLLGLTLSAFLMAGCSGGDQPAASAGAQEGGSGKATAEAASDEPTPPATEFVTLTDPVENAYSLDMPKGWHNRVYSARVYDIHSTVDTTVSPNGSVLTFNGDPSLPQYYNPDHATEIHHNIARNHPKMKIEYFVPAEEYFPEYVKRKFGKLPDFQITEQGAHEEMQEKLQQRFNEAGLNVRATCARVRFTYTDNGKKMNALILGSSTDSGPIWIVTVTGISTWGQPDDYLPMLEAMEKTRKQNPQWQAEQQQKHQQRMAQIEEFGRQMTAQHHRNMAWIQQSAQRHQERMQAIWSANDASMKSYYDRMASGDVQHQRFLNYINEENTVVSPTGQTMQVDNSYQRYYVNKNNNTYIGGDITMDHDKLRSLGVNPDDYVEAKIKP